MTAPTAIPAFAPVERPEEEIDTATDEGESAVEVGVWKNVLVVACTIVIDVVGVDPDNEIDKTSVC